MDTILKVMLFGGLIGLCLTHIYIVVKSFGHGMKTGLITCFIGPLGIPFVSTLKNDRNLQNAFDAWLASTVFLILGTGYF
jgi:hypothetical protein